MATIIAIVGQELQLVYRIYYCGNNMFSYIAISTFIKFFLMPIRFINALNGLVVTNGSLKHVCRICMQIVWANHTMKFNHVCTTMCTQSTATHLLSTSTIICKPSSTNSDGVRRDVDRLKHRCACGARHTERLNKLDNKGEIFHDFETP